MRRRLWLGGVAALLLAGVAWAAPGIGDTAPNFVLKDINGNTHSLASKKGNAKAVAIVWMSYTCPISEAYNARYKALHNEFKDKGVSFFFINSNSTENVEEMRAHAKRNGFNFTILRDPGNEVADDYGAQRTPEVFLLDSDLVLRYHGAIDNNRDPDRVDPNKRYARNALNSILAGRRPNPSEVPAFGCTIKRAK